ncbi:MAG TPA: hypothetical protein PKX13_13840 [Acidiphilium sp.]|nr:hypothetical protein [Acidiphilium sp.]
MPPLRLNTAPTATSLALRAAHARRFDRFDRRAVRPPAGGQIAGEKAGGEREPPALLVPTPFGGKI